MRVRLPLALGLALLPFLAQSSEFGYFIGAVQAEWLPDGRRMRLLADFKYVAPGDTLWVAPKGSTIDGASIPRVFWSFIGGPFEGKYRNASVIHDVACVERKRPFKSVHRMFYSASRAAGVDPRNGRLMYGAIFLFGPRWPDPKSPKGPTVKPTAYHVAPDSLTPPLRTDADFLRLRAFIMTRPPISLDSIERITSAGLASAIPEVPSPRPGLLPEGE